MFPTRIEVVPADGIVDKVRGAVPRSTTVTVTCLPQHGIGRTLQTTLALADAGYQVVPHLAAKTIADRAQLGRILRDCDSAGVREVFAIGGDAARPAGPYPSGAALMEDIAELSGGGIAIGIAGYPEGHPAVSELDLLESLLAKQELASGVVTQMCFSAGKILDYVRLLRREGVVLPVWAGVAGGVPRAKLVSLAGQIGVGASLKFLTRKGPLARKLLSGDRYSPRALVADLAEHPEIVAGIHFYSFNQLDSHSLDNSAGFSLRPDAAPIESTPDQGNEPVTP